MKVIGLILLVSILSVVIIAGQKETLNGYWTYDSVTLKLLQKPFIDALQQVPKDKRQQAEMQIQHYLQSYLMAVVYTQDLKLTYFIGGKTKEIQIKVISEKENQLNVEFGGNICNVTVEKDKIIFDKEGHKTTYIRISKEKALKMIEAGNKISKDMKKKQIK
jgi:hypothetical protein